MDSVMNILERPIGTFRDFLKESPVFDIAETEKEVNVRVEVPGLSQDELSVSYSEGILTVSGEKKEQKERKTEEEAFLESRFSSFKKEISLGENLNWENSKASYSNGVLKIQIPKKEVEISKSVKINIE